MTNDAKFARVSDPAETAARRSPRGQETFGRRRGSVRDRPQLRHSCFVIYQTSMPGPAKNGRAHRAPLKNPSLVTCTPYRVTRRGVDEGNSTGPGMVASLVDCDPRGDCPLLRRKKVRLPIRPPSEKGDCTPCVGHFDSS